VRALVVSFLRKLEKENQSASLNVMNHLLGLFVEEVNSSRLSMPLLSTMDFVIESGLTDAAQEQNKEYMHVISKTTWLCIKKTSDPVKKISGAGVLCSILRFETCCKQSLAFLVCLLCSPLPRVRMAVAEKLHVSVLTFSENCIPTSQEESLDTCLGLLSDTNWTRPVPDLRPIRDQIASIFGVRSPTSS